MRVPLPAACSPGAPIFVPECRFSGTRVCPFPRLDAGAARVFGPAGGWLQIFLVGGYSARSIRWRPRRLTRRDACPRSRTRFRCPSRRSPRAPTPGTRRSPTGDAWLTPARGDVCSSTGCVLGSHESRKKAPRPRRRSVSMSALSHRRPLRRTRYVAPQPLPAMFVEHSRRRASRRPPGCVRRRYGADRRLGSSGRRVVARAPLRHVSLGTRQPGCRRRQRPRVAAHRSEADGIAAVSSRQVAALVLDHACGVDLILWLLGCRQRVGEDLAAGCCRIDEPVGEGACADASPILTRCTPRAHPITEANGAFRLAGPARSVAAYAELRRRSAELPTPVSKLRRRHPRKLALSWAASVRSFGDSPDSSVQRRSRTSESRIRCKSLCEGV